MVLFLWNQFLCIYGFIGYSYVNCEYNCNLGVGMLLDRLDQYLYELNFVWYGIGFNLVWDVRGGGWGVLNVKERFKYIIVGYIN